eukprot:12498871-Prorocentrum_lima.AAC.1
MTSSLVGSEMCIRDRPIAAWQLASKRVAKLSGIPAPGQLMAPVSRACACLLYTSDAADDM